MILAACAPKPPPAPRAARNLLLVTIDTLRADRLGAYGNTTVATPNLDRLARETGVSIVVDPQAAKESETALTLRFADVTLEVAVRMGMRA